MPPATKLCLQRGGLPVSISLQVKNTPSPIDENLGLFPSTTGLNTYRIW